MKKIYFQLSLLSLISNPILAIERLNSGCTEVAQFVKKYLPENPVIFEAGCYDALDTKIMANFWPNSIIHAFEPIPSLYNHCKWATQDNKNINIYPLALSDKIGTATFYVSEYVWSPGNPGASSSLLEPHEHIDRERHVVFPQQITVNTITINSWAKENNISHIDLMWLDMQGHELTALKAANNILHKVKLIYTEVEFVKAYKNQALYKDVKAWLALQGFRVLALDFDENHGLRDDIPVGEQYYGNALFINEKYYPQTN